MQCREYPIKDRALLGNRETVGLIKPEGVRAESELLPKRFPPRSREAAVCVLCGARCRAGNSDAAS